MTELEACDKHIVAKLGAVSALTTLLGDGASGIHRELAPEGAAYPLIEFGHQGGAPRNLVGPSRVWEDSLYRVKCITDTTFEDAEAVMALVDTNLKYTSASYSGTTVRSPYRVGTIRFSEVRDGKRYNHYGFLYRIIASTPGA